MSEELTLRSFEERDLDAVLRCFQRSVHAIAARSYAAAQLAAWAPEHPDTAMWRERLSRGCTLLATTGDALAGFVSVQDGGYIDLIYVDPDFERRGVGRTLLSAAIEWARSRGARRFHADVSLAARPLFEAAGFRVEREQSVERRGVRLTNYRMSRDYPP